MSAEEEQKEPLFSEELTRRLQFCLRCGECNLHCPIYRAFGFNEAYSPRGWVNLASMLSLREIPVFIDKIEHMYLSVLCGSCDPPCPYDVRPSELILAARKELIDLGYVPPLDVAAIPRRIRSNLPLLEPSPQEEWMPPEKAGPSESTVLYLGRWALNSPESASAASELAWRFFKAPALADSRPSCGEVLRLAGYFDEAREELELLVERLEGMGVREVLTACPEAASRISELGVEARSLLEALSEAQVVDEKVASKKLSKGVLLVPECVDRSNEAALELLSAAGVPTTLASFCASCGYTITYNARPDVVGRLGEDLASQAEVKGAPLVAFVHPAAYSAVRAALRGAKLKPKILDVFQLLLQVAKKP